MRRCFILDSLARLFAALRVRVKPGMTSAPNSLNVAAGAYLVRGRQKGGSHNCQLKKFCKKIKKN